MQRPFSLRDRERYIGASAGIALSCDNDSVQPERLVREADIALYWAKAAGKGKAAVFHAGMSDLAVERMEAGGD